MSRNYFSLCKLCQSIFRTKKRKKTDNPSMDNRECTVHKFMYYFSDVCVTRFHSNCEHLLIIFYVSYLKDKLYNLLSSRFLDVLSFVFYFHFYSGKTITKISELIFPMLDEGAVIFSSYNVFAMRIVYHRISAYYIFVR